MNRGIRIGVIQLREMIDKEMLNVLVLGMLSAMKKRSTVLRQCREGMAGENSPAAGWKVALEPLI